MNRLQQLREAAALSRADLARRSDVSQKVIEQLEAGAHLEEAERAVEVPGETPVEDIAVILNKLADALGANLIEKEIAVTPDELLEPARDDLPAAPETSQAAQPGDETQAALPLVGVSHAPPEGDLPPEARSHNETETPDDVDAALKQLALDSQVTASEQAAVTGADEVAPEPEWPDGPVSPAASTSEDAAQGGQAPIGGTETINMAELPDTLPIGVLPGTAPFVETEEVSPISGQGVVQTADPDQEFASQETQEIYLPPEVRATLPQYPSPSEGDAAVEAAQQPVNLIEPAVDNQATQPLKMSREAGEMPGEVEKSDPNSIEPALEKAGETGGVATDAPTLQFDLSEVRGHPVKDTTELEKEEMAPTLETASTTAQDNGANLGLETAHDVEEVVPNRAAPLIPPVEPTTLEREAATPAQDDAPLTKVQPEQQPEMSPYVSPGPTAAEESRYKLPLNTVIPSVIGVAGVLAWYAWRSWRRSRAEAERVAPYFKKK